MLAEKLHKTVKELLTGEPGPLSPMEFKYWRAYQLRKRKLEEKAAKKQNKPSRR